MKKGGGVGLALLLTTLALSLLVAGVSAQLGLVMLPNAQAVGAVCNDGSPAGFYYRAGNPNLWIVHLQGGGWCFDQSSCAQRMSASPTFMSSRSWSRTFAPSGLFSSNCINNPSWCGATVVYIPYCTSDSFSGTRNPSPSTFGWYFRGKTVLQEVIAAARQVLLSGCSAGGAAVLANLDFVASLLPPLPVRVFKGHVDAGWFLDATPMIPQNQARMSTFFILGQALWGGIPDQSCAMANPNAIWRCYMGQYAYNHIATPMLIHQDSEDFVQLLIGGMSLPFDTQKQMYLNEFRLNITRSLQQVPPPHAVYSPACYWHCSTESDQFWSIRIDNSQADRDALNGFYFYGITGRWIDPCPGFSCSSGCPPPPVAEKLANASSLLSI